MKVRIVREECIECGGCEVVCPEIFELKDGRKASIVKSYRTKNLSEGEIKDDFISCIEEAVDVCPVDVITIERTNDVMSVS